LTTFERLVRGSFAPSVLLLFSLLFSFAAYAQGDNISQQIANLQDSDPRIRANAATDLGRFKDPRGVEPLIVALGDKNAKVRGQAAWALGQLHDLKATKPLIGLLKEKDMTVQLGVSMALGELKDPASIQPLIEAMNDRSLGDGRFPGAPYGKLDLRRWSH
jgi:HEAT repeat protein